MSNTIIEKICSKCKILFPISNFYKDGSQINGFSYRCKQCQEIAGKCAKVNARKRGFVRVINRKLLTRLFSAVKISTEHFYKGVPCWEWQQSLDKDGYGKTSYHQKDYRAHRLFYDLFVEFIPPHLMCDHLCRNHRCVNPIHIEPVTVRENSLRGIGVAAINAQKTHCPKGHQLEGDNLVNQSYGRTCKTCANAHSLRYYKEKETPESRTKNNARLKNWADKIKALPESHPQKIAWRERGRARCAKWQLKQKQKRLLQSEG